MYKVLKHTFRFWAFFHERDPGLADYPTLTRLHGKLSPRLTGLPYLADRATRLSCKRDRNKIRNYMDRRVTPPRQVISTTRNPPPLCKQVRIIHSVRCVLSERVFFWNLKNFRVERVMRFRSTYGLHFTEANPWEWEQPGAGDTSPPSVTSGFLTTNLSDE